MKVFDPKEALAPLESSQITVARRLLTLRDRRSASRPEQWQVLVPCTVVETLFRSSLQAIPATFVERLFIHLVDTRCHKEALAMAVSTQESALKRGMLRTLVEHLGSGQLRRLVEREIARQDEIYAGRPVRLPRVPDPKPNERESVDRFLERLTSNPERCTWQGALAVVRQRKEALRLIEAMKAAHCDASILEVLFLGKKGPIRDPDEAIAYCEWSRRLESWGCSLDSRKLPHLGTSLRAARASYLAGLDRQEYRRRLMGLTEGEQVVELQFLQSVNVHDERLLEVCTVGAQVCDWLIRLLESRDATVIKKLFWDIVRENLSDAGSYSIHRDHFLSVVSEQVPSSEKQRDWLARRRTQPSYKKALRGLRPEVNLENWEMLRDPVIMTDLLAGEVPGVRFRGDALEAFEKLLKRLVHSGVGPLFHGFSTACRMGWWLIQPSAIPALTQALERIEAYLTDSDSARKEILHRSRRLVRQRQFRDALHELKGLPALTEEHARLAAECAHVMGDSATMLEMSRHLPEQERKVLGAAAAALDRTENRLSKLAEASRALTRETEEIWFWSALSALAESTGKDLEHWRKMKPPLPDSRALVNLVWIAAGWFEPSCFEAVACSALVCDIAYRFGGWPAGSFSSTTAGAAWAEAAGLHLSRPQESSRLFKAQAPRSLQARVLRRLAKGKLVFPASQGLLLQTIQDSDGLMRLLHDPAPWERCVCWSASAAARLKSVLEPDTPDWDLLLERTRGLDGVQLDLALACSQPRPEVTSLVSKLSSDELGCRFIQIVDYVERSRQGAAVAAAAGARSPVLALRLTARHPRTSEERRELQRLLDETDKWLRTWKKSDAIRPVALRATEEFQDAFRKAPPSMRDWVLERLHHLSTNDDYRESSTRAKHGTDVYCIGWQHEAGRILFVYDRARRTLQLLRLFARTEHDRYERALRKGRASYMSEPSEWFDLGQEMAKQVATE